MSNTLDPRHVSSNCTLHPGSERASRNFLHATSPTESVGYYLFEFRMYTLKELGALYFPWRKAYGSASKALSTLIRGDGELLKRLRAVGYRKGLHNLSPAMVKLIVEYLGTPQEFSEISHPRS